ncbi:TonB-dependent receptor plug domain-containing protein [Flavihumibacter sp. R14]|nr:TonB-dependent receptor plug domain-containing protein [Flavihumibacter soli]
MKKPILIGLLLFAAVGIGFIVQDDDPLKPIIAQLEKFRKDYIQEKVHIHFDKPYYAIGDNIWFKAYVVEAENHQLSHLSRILYVDLINDKDSIKQSLRLPLNGGVAWGDFTLADNLREGNYRIRAYTTWMRNFGEDYFFDKTINIGNSISNTVFTKTEYKYSTIGANQKVDADILYTDLQGEPLANKAVDYNVQLNFRSISKGKGITDNQGHLRISFINNQPFLLKSGKIHTSIKLNEKRSVSKTVLVNATSDAVDIQFFPESGNLVYGIRSKVAFKAVGANGLGTPVSGYVVDQNNERLADLKTEHAGMGVFALRPEEGKTYKAMIQFQDGSEKSFDLPKPSANGYVITVNSTDSAKFTIKVAVSPSLQETGELKLVAQTNGVIQYAAKSPLDKSVFTATLEKKRFPTGILQLTLFSPTNTPVAERLVFINHSTPLSIQISPDKQESKTRGKVKLTLNTRSADGNPTNGSFSMAVIDESNVPFEEANEITILSNLLLTSDLKGYIEKPNYYFADTDDEKARRLDLLMLTQGWRRFIWKNILSNTFPSIVYPPETTIKLSGTVTANNNGKPVVGGRVTLFSASGDVFLMDTITDERGRFTFKDLYFDDSTEFVVQARNQNGRKNVQIELDGNPPQLVTKNKNMADEQINANDSYLVYLLNSRKQYEELKRYGINNPSIMLQEVKIVETRPRVQNSSNLNGAGNADYIITEKDLEYAIDLPTYLQGRLAGIIIRNGIAYSMRSMTSSFSGLVPMQLIMDGTFVSPDFLGVINPRDVESIEVLKSASNTAIYGIRGGGGVILINTKRGERDMTYGSYAAGIVSFKPQGLYRSREFYSPNYDDPKINPKIADLRTTVYWNPNIITDTTGKAMVEFFNGDNIGSHAVIVEGINSRGEIGRSVYRYTVN